MCDKTTTIMLKVTEKRESLSNAEIHSEVFTDQVTRSQEFASKYPGGRGTEDGRNKTEHVLMMADMG